MARKPQPPPKNFELALRELEQILGEIEAGEIGLEESILRYERGTFLIQHCRGVLATAEKQIELLSRGPEGDLASEPYSGALPEATPLVGDGPHAVADADAEEGF